MAFRSQLAAAVLTLLGATAELAGQEPYVAPNSPVDKPVTAVIKAEQERLDSAVAPYIAQARATYPAARERYLAGLPPRHHFFVTLHLTDRAERRETIFLAVDSLVRDSVYGRIWNEIYLVQGYRRGTPYATAESAILDWLITRPDGTEEGNFVGRFLDSYGR